MELSLINHVIKRNGRKVKFQPDKLNKLSSWASTEGVSWSQIALTGLKKLSDNCTVQDIIIALIQTCLDAKTEAHLKVAGKLYVADMYKRVFFYTDDNSPPSLIDFRKRMLEEGLYLPLASYTEEEINTIDSFLKHDSDFNLVYTQIHQMEDKYLLKERVKTITYETPQFMYARIAMAVFEKEPNRLVKIEDYLNSLGADDLNLPSPNWANIGTTKKTGTSCCLYSIEDTSKSISAGHHIADTMNISGAGLGNIFDIRSINDPVKKGLIKHQGKLGYLKAQQAIVKSNKQGSRGGALTTHFTVLDPEFKTLAKARNPTTVDELKVDEIDYSFTFPALFWKHVALNKEWMFISRTVAPDLYSALYNSDELLFEKLFNKYFNDSSIAKQILKARDVTSIALPEQYETGRLYHGNLTEIAHHTPFNTNVDPIPTSNLCQEILLSHKPFHSVLELYDKYSSEYLYITYESGKEEVVKDFYSTWQLYKDLKNNPVYNNKIVKTFKFKNEIALCNIGAINLGRDYTDEEYINVCYNMLKTINYVIDNSEYAFPNVEYTSKQRMSAGVGISNLAVELARKGYYYSSVEGKKYMHFLAERHYYCLLEASLRISKEEGKVAGWMYKTKWTDETPWLPIDTYNKNVDTIADFKYHYDWSSMRERIKLNGGIYHTTLVAHMPCEASSQKANSSNSLYPLRKLIVIKTDGSKRNVFIAPNSDLDPLSYELAWDIPTKDLVDVYAIFQKFDDQSISADFYRDFTKAGQETVGMKELTENFLYKNKMGLKTQYYSNSKTKDKEDEATDTGCSSGACSL